jgi:hypothetical protein
MGPPYLKDNMNNYKMPDRHFVGIQRAGLINTIYLIVDLASLKPVLLEDLRKVVP